MYGITNGGAAFIAAEKLMTPRLLDAIRGGPAAGTTHVVADCATIVSARRGAGRVGCAHGPWRVAACSTADAGASRSWRPLGVTGVARSRPAGAADPLGVGRAVRRPAATAAPA